eukprot:GEMP01003672.1.p1 GENE.GEMP01003672.1~~GEMP01003672.1.p1  ORF type:complete len:1159 (+),score=233.76 GEMP01003672.1:303-3479(+)
MARLEVVKNSMVKRRGAEADFLKQVEKARDILQVALQGDKMKLDAVYGGQCMRIGKLRYMLQTVQLSAMYANDQRWKHIEARVESVESILKDLGTYREWVPPTSSLESMAEMGTVEEVHQMNRGRAKPSLAGSWDNVADMTLDCNGCFSGQNDHFFITQNGDEVQIFVGDELRGKGWYDENKKTFVGTLNGERISGTVGDDGELIFANGEKWGQRPANISGIWDRCSTDAENDALRFTISQKGTKVTATEQGNDEFPFIGEVTTDGVKLTRKRSDQGCETEEVMIGKLDDSKKHIVWADNNTWSMSSKTIDGATHGDKAGAMPALTGVWDDITQIALDFWSCLREQDDGIRIVQNGKDMEIYVADELCGNASYDADQKKMIGTLKDEHISATVDGDEQMKFSNGKRWAKRPVDIAGAWDKSSPEADNVAHRVHISQKGPVVTATSQDDEELIELIGEVTANMIKFTRKGAGKAGEGEKTMTGKLDDAKEHIVWADNTTWSKLSKANSTAEIDRACPIPSLAGVWDDVTDSAQDFRDSFSGQKDEVRVMQNEEDVEIFVADKSCGKVSYDKKKKQFIGTFNDEEVIAMVDDDGHLTFSNGRKWAHRPVNIVGTWDRCPTEDDSTALRISLWQKGAKVLATAEGDPDFELSGEITADGIKFTREASDVTGEEAEIMTGKFDDTQKDIIWADDSMWLKRPALDVEGVWDEVPDTGCASYNQGMVITMVGPKVSCDHVTLCGGGAVNDDSAITFGFDKRGESVGKADTEIATMITWTDGTQWKRRTEIVTDPPNIMEGSGICDWRRKHSFGPLPRSFYLDALKDDAENEGFILPDLFVENKKSSGETQRAFNKAFGSFCERIDAVETLEEVLAQPGAGITMPENWMVWMVHRVWLNDPTLTTLSFANMEMPDAQTVKNVGPKLMEALKRNTYLEHLELPNTNLQSGDIIQMLGEAIIENTTLKSINLEGNAIDSPSLMILADALTQNKALEILKVQHQKTRSSGVQVEEHFSDALDLNKTLTKLGIELNNPHHRDQIGRKLMRNSEIKRRKRLAIARSSSNV